MTFDICTTTEGGAPACPAASLRARLQIFDRTARLLRREVIAKDFSDTEIQRYGENWEAWRNKRYLHVISPSHPYVHVPPRLVFHTFSSLSPRVHKYVTC